MKRRGALWGLVLAFGMLVSAGPAPPAAAQEKKAVNFVLDWIVGGCHSGWFDSAGSTNIVLFPMLAKVAGIDADKVKWVIVAPHAKMPTFKAEKGHGVLFFNMQLPLMEKASAEQGGVGMIVFGDYLPLYSNGILVTDDYLPENPETVRRFVRASMKGWAYAFAHPDEAAAFVRKDSSSMPRREGRDTPGQGADGKPRGQEARPRLHG
jgi:ABC-type nitrate/sulfonate/bicarbonate transport system substrate-binding protein